MDSVIDDEESYCYNERNELTQRKNLLSVREYIYDENGSLTKEKEGERETGYRYDLLNRQSYVSMPDGREQENLYDGEGLRARLTENGKSTTFLFYNGEILAECNGDSMPIRRHLSGAGLSHVQNLENNTFHAYHQDEQGSTAYVTGTTGETENLYSYDGFGNLLESREDIANRILYTGQQYDQETGQYYLRARYYNPVIGRFTQEDTYRGDGLNLYAYCDNNPVMYYDPSGHGCEDNTQAETAPQPVDGVDEGGIIHNDILDSPRTGSALKVDEVKPRYEIDPETGKSYMAQEFPGSAQAHGFSDIVDNYAGYATKTPLNNADLYQLEGSLNGVPGRFEWIIQDGQVTHRMFVQNGTMNGVPIKP